MGDTWISLGRKNRIYFINGLKQGVCGVGQEQEDQLRKGRDKELRERMRGETARTEEHLRL